MNYMSLTQLTATVSKAEGSASRLIIPPKGNETAFLRRWKTKFLDLYVLETKLERQAPLTSKDILKSIEECASSHCDHCTLSLREPHCSLLKVLGRRTSLTVLSSDFSTKLEQLQELLSDPLTAAILTISNNPLTMEYLCWRLPEETLSTTADIGALLRRIAQWCVVRLQKMLLDLNYDVPFITEYLALAKLDASMIPMKCPAFGPGQQEYGLTDMKDNESFYSMTTEEDYPSDYSSDCWMSTRSKSLSREDSPLGSQRSSMSPATDLSTSGTRSQSPIDSMSLHYEGDFM